MKIVERKKVRTLSMETVTFLTMNVGSCTPKAAQVGLRKCLSNTSVDSAKMFLNTNLNSRTTGSNNTDILCLLVGTTLMGLADMICTPVGLDMKTVIMNILTMNQQT